MTMAIKPIESCDLPLYLLGSRDYVNGLTQFEEILGCYRAMSAGRAAPASAVKSFEMNSFLRCDARASLFETAALRGRPELRSAATRMDLTTPAGPRTMVLHADPERPVTRRLAEYDRGRYIVSDETTRNGDSLVSLTKIGGFVDLVRGVVEVNHRFVIAHARQAGVDRRVSWAWLRRMACLSDEAAASIRRIRFAFVRSLAAGDRCYVVRTLHLESADGSDGAEFAFFY